MRSPFAKVTQIVNLCRKRGLVCGCVEGNTHSVISSFENNGGTPGVAAARVHRELRFHNRLSSACGDVFCFRSQGLAPTVSTSSGTTSSGNGPSSPPFDAMMVDNNNSSNTHRRGAGVDCSREVGISSVSAAVAAVVATPPAHAEMHRVLSAPMLSPPANSARVGSGMDQNRLPPLRQETSDGRKQGGFTGSSARENGSSMDLGGPPAGAAGLGRDSTMRSPRSHTRHLSESALPSAAMAAAAAVAMQTEPMEEASWAPSNIIRRAPSR